ncbi:MAG: glutamine--tRNA ligase/YqeY domain fusion protein [Gammaproteobacteria bacterium]|nr:glutamine--tRNA ligase/YqeY domain fusion protein [Gammaproteobacteria bacterium]MYD76779.1 glutamine--tRNA ligase/YqeY domain fusion protein [Gammaproteobacteria bacterium]MYJ52762.1 glutamine--tRNA ligase/YqeY domain fusion protein [Gammaproteobacteria bacterium]
MSEEIKPVNFVRQIIDDDIRTGRHQEIVTRFPPEPNGYLHIGHCKSIWLNFGIKDDYRGRCTLRFDDTNPLKESQKFASMIEEDIRWLGYEWTTLAHASDYFEQLYDYAVHLIREGLAFVDSQSSEQIREQRGTLTEPGTDSPFRTRAVEENLSLFKRMRNGEFADGEHVLRAKIDMASPNINLRDPVLYRIRHHAHQRTGDRWCIYPMYDFAHGQGDAIEGVTHSLCTLEFEDHRALYDWFIEHLPVPSRPRQIEFSRLNLNYTVMSKRLLTRLVELGHVDGWDDPRMPTISGLRRRGYTPASLRNFIASVGITRKPNVIEMGLLEKCVREDLDPTAPRAMAVLRPLKVVIENYPEGASEVIEAPRHPHKTDLGTRQLVFSREIFVERSDYLDDPPKGYFRLAPGREVRLRHAYVIRCTEVVRDEQGEPVELRCQYDPETGRGQAPDGRKVKGIIHWVSANHSVRAQVRLYDRLFSVPDPLSDRDRDFLEALNPHSLECLKECRLETSLGQADRDTRYQFERVGYFFQDAQSAPDALVFNRIVSLRDTWMRKSGQSPN